MKRIFAMLLAVVMMLSMGVVAFAEETVASQEDLNAAITAANGATTIELADGNYTLPGMSEKEITFKGTKDVIINIAKGTAATNSSLTFEGVTLDFGNDNYIGIQHTTKVIYNNCAIKGLQTLYATTEVFTNCVFTNLDTYNIWTYGAKDVTFTGCTFYSGGRCIYVYNEMTDRNFAANVNFVKCTFNDNDSQKEDNGTDDLEKGAVETGSNGGNNEAANKYNITFKDCVANGFQKNNSTSPLWGNKHNLDANHLTVTVTGVSTEVKPTENKPTVSTEQTVTAPAGAEGETAKTATVTVSNTKPADSTNTSTVTKVTGLENVVVSDKVEDKGSVTVAITEVKEVTESPDEEEVKANTAITEIEEKMEDAGVTAAKVEYIDITITAGDTSVTDLGKGNLLTFVIPGTFGENTKVYHYHGDTVLELTEKPTEGDQGFEIKEDGLYIYLSQFSVIAIATDAVVADVEPETPVVKPDPCDHKFDANGKCERCGIIVIDHTDKKPAEEENPNTGAESVIGVVAAVAALSFAGAVIAKRK